MKVTNRLLYSQLVKDLDNNSEKLFKLNSQISSGKRINAPSDDPLGMSNVLTYRTELNAVNQYKKSVDYATGWISSTDSILQDMQNIMDRADELAVQGASETSTSDTRQGAAEEIRQLRGEMLNLANSKYGNKYLFGGTMTQTQPFLDVDVEKWEDDVVNTAGMGAAVPASAADGSKFINTTDNHVYQYSTATATWTDLGAAADGARYINTADNDIYQYNAGAGTWSDLGATAEGTSVILNDKNELYVFTGGEWKDFYQGNGSTFSMQIGKGENSVEVNIPGSDIFLNSTGNVFMTLMRLEKALRGDDQAGARNELSNIEASGTTISNNLARLGAVVNRLDHTTSILEESTVDIQKRTSNIEDLDYAEGITSLQNQQTIYQAALKSASMITSLSLVDYIQ